MTSQAPAQQPQAEAPGISGYISLLFAVIFFSGVAASANWWGIFDFTTLNGAFGKVVSGVAEKNGEMFALSLVPTIMFAMAMITIFEHYGALRAARQMLTPVLRPLLGLPGSTALAMIASLQSTDGGAALTRQLKDAGEIDENETTLFATFQMTADASITNFFSSGAVLFTLLAANGEPAVPVSLGLCLGIILLGKVFSTNLMRLILIRRSRKA